MSFLQLYYTSCENGLSGYSGFQFCAVTPGVGPEIMRDIEQMTIYETPRPVTAGEGDQQEGELPVNLIYTHSGDLRRAIISQVKSTGIDFSNRSGNYFAHSLVTLSPEEDLRHVLPVELWDAPFWVSRQGSLTDLPILPNLPSNGAISRDIMSDFLTEKPGRKDQIATLLTAVDGAMAGDCRILLVADDSATVCRWIAAVSYLIGPSLARQLTFSTYNYDPRRCHTHLVGTVATGPRLSSDVTASFQIFDLVRGAIPEIASSSAASLLVRVGIGDAGRLWQVAISLGAPASVSLADSFPILVTSALMLEHRLTPAEFEVAIDWLTENNDEGVTARLATAVRSALNQPTHELSVMRKKQLVELAARADEIRGDRGSQMTVQIESSIVEDAFRDIEARQAIVAGFPLRTPAALKAVTDGCKSRVQSADPVQAIEMLAWAADAGASIDPPTAYRAGRGIMVPTIAAQPARPRLHQAAAAWPALVMGMADKLAEFPAATQQQVLAGPMADLFCDDHFIGKPALQTEWLIASAYNNRLPPAGVLLRISHLKRANEHRLAADEELIARLWRNQPWTAAEALELIENLPPDEVCVTAVLHRFEKVLSNVPKDDLPSYERFVARLAELPEGALPRVKTKLVRELVTAFGRVRETERTLPNADRQINELLDYYLQARETTQAYLDDKLPQLLMAHSVPAEVLHKCPPELFDHFCIYASSQMGSHALEKRRIAMLIVAMYDLAETHRSYAAQLESRVLWPNIASWPRQEALDLADIADRYSANARRSIEQWNPRAAGWRRRILG